MSLLNTLVLVGAVLAAVVGGLVVWLFRSLVKSLNVNPHALPQGQTSSASVFASYSRKDAMLVEGLVGLFRATQLSVFLDRQNIQPGREWRIAIDSALEQCQTILVFWCGHAAESSEVRNEYERAITLDKRVVPVLMDETLLPADLGKYQGVDLRMAFGGSHESLIDVLAAGSGDLLGGDRLCAAEMGIEPGAGEMGPRQDLAEQQQRFAAASRTVEVARLHLESSLDSIL